VKASLAQKTKKLFGGFFGFKTFLTVFLIALFFNIGTTKAQLTGPVPSTSVNFDEFACLFTKTDSNGKCTHNPDETNIKTGAESAINTQTQTVTENTQNNKTEPVETNVSLPETSQIASSDKKQKCVDFMAHARFESQAASDTFLKNCLAGK
jgi:hypothetical protein